MMIKLFLFLFASIHVFGECPFKMKLYNEQEKEMVEVGVNNDECSKREPFFETRDLKVDPDIGTTTNMGCSCDSVCGATGEDGFNCDWCYTKNNCGHWSTVRQNYWDWCVYPELGTESQLYLQKHAQAWNNVNADTTPAEYPNLLYILGISIQTSFDDWWDIMPAGRLKGIHSVGAVCEIEMQITSTEYTGIFTHGAAKGFIRMGSATMISQNGMTPGNGFKFYRTGFPSANWVTLHSLDGQKGFNFFDNDQSNHIPPATGITAQLAKKFTQASNCVTMVGLSDAAKYRQDGTDDSAKINFPYQLIFQPTDAAKATMGDNQISLEKFIQDMSAIPSGTVLYDMYAVSAPQQESSKIGEIIMTSKCTGSKWGDERMFFRHQRMEEDWDLKPEWMPLVDVKGECGSGASVTVDPPKKCTENDLSKIDNQKNNNYNNVIEDEKTVD